MNLSEEDYHFLRELQQNEREKRNYVKVTVLLMLHLGKSKEDIVSCLGISVSTVNNYYEKYNLLGIQAYLQDHYKSYEGKLSEVEKQELQVEIETNLYQNTAQIVALVKGKFGKVYTSQGIVPLLHRLGFSYKKTKLVPCEADREKQQAFVEQFSSLMQDLKEEEGVYFSDAVHPQHNTRSGYAWIKKGEEKEIPSVSGRSRINLNGAMNAKTPQEIIIREDERINAQSTWALYEQMMAQNPTKTKIYVICDNARYYKNKDLQEKIKNSKIEQIFLPPYSPNLNLIERLWKFTRKKVIDYHFYRSFEDFKKLF